MMAVGFDGNTLREASDRTFELPYIESGLIRTMAAANLNIIVVLNLFRVSIGNRYIVWSAMIRDRSLTCPLM